AGIKMYSYVPSCEPRTVIQAEIELNLVSLGLIQWIYQWSSKEITFCMERKIMISMNHTNTSVCLTRIWVGCSISVHRYTARNGITAFMIVGDNPISSDLFPRHREPDLARSIR